MYGAETLYNAKNVTLYRAETDTWKGKEKGRIEPLKVWLGRRREGVLWKDRMENEKIFRRVHESIHTSNKDVRIVGEVVLD